MARVQYGTIVTGLSGSVGGNVFARNINGNYTRRKSRNVNRNTISQANFRNAFGSIQRLWRSLTTSQRNTWAVATPLYPYVNSLGVTSYYTSFQLFSKLNNQLFNVGVSAVFVAPAPVSIDGLVFNAAIYAAGSAVLAVSLTDTTTALQVVPIGFVLRLLATNSLSSGIEKPPASAFRIIHDIPPGGSMVDNTLLPLYVQLFGHTPLVGSNVFFEAFLVSKSNGQRGSSVRSSVLFA